MKFIELEKVILSSVRDVENILIDFLTESFNLYINLSEYTSLPIKNMYNSPKSLGNDRIAAVVAGNYLFPENNVLVFDAGTALTIDFINSKGEYLGGNISPGIEMRFKALNYYTDKLPKLTSKTNYQKLLGNDTNSAIMSGVQQGIVFEVNEYINTFTKDFNDLKIVFTGGDNFFFAKKLKNNIFADSHLVLKGLNRILEYNAK